MQDSENPAPVESKRTPWNKGKLTGAKPPLRPKHVWSIRTKLQMGRPQARPGAIQSCHRQQVAWLRYHRSQSRGHCPTRIGH
jgi:hypothetical protein